MKKVYNSAMNVVEVSKQCVYTTYVQEESVSAGKFFWELVDASTRGIFPVNLL